MSDVGFRMGSRNTRAPFAAEVHATFEQVALNLSQRSVVALPLVIPRSHRPVVPMQEEQMLSRSDLQWYGMLIGDLFDSSRQQSSETGHVFVLRVGEQAELRESGCAREW